MVAFDPKVGWRPASAAAMALVRAVVGPTAVLRYIDHTYGRAPGRTYYIHVAEVDRPVSTLTLKFPDLERMRYEHGDRVDTAAAERMLADELDAGANDTQGNLYP